MTPQGLAVSPGLPNDSVHVWHIALHAEPARIRLLGAMLSPPERRRADDEDTADGQRRYTVAHAALREILGGYLGSPPQRIDIEFGPQGKPRLAGTTPVPPLEFNLSHVDDVAVLAVSNGRPVGVDLSGCRPDFPAAAFASRYFPAPERDEVLAAGPEAQRAWRRLWARKEACVKAAGARVALGLALPVNGPGDRRVVWDPSGRLPGRWNLRDLPCPHGYALCVALAGRRSFRVAGRDWTADP